MRCFRHVQNERGATLILMVALIIVLLGISALAVDVGQLYIAKQRAQNVCDAAALAGARHLTGEASCTSADGPAATAAHNCASSNNTEVNKWQINLPGTETPGVTVDFPTSVTDLTGTTTTVQLGQAIHVTGNVKANFAFAAALFASLHSQLVPASATAVLDLAGSVQSKLFVPLAIDRYTIFGEGTTPPINLDPDSPTYLLHFKTWQNDFLGAGNFGSLDYAKNGGSGYQSLLAGDGTGQNLSIQPATQVDTLPGEKSGPTVSGFRQRLQKETNPNYMIENQQDLSNPDCWEYWCNHMDPTTGLHDFTWRLALIPVIENPDPAQSINGKSTVDVVGMAGFFIERVHTKDETINGVTYRKGDVEGHFIQGIRFGENIEWIFPTGDTTPDNTQMILAVKLLS